MLYHFLSRLITKGCVRLSSEHICITCAKSWISWVSEKMLECSEKLKGWLCAAITWLMVLYLVKNCQQFCLVLISILDDFFFIPDCPFWWFMFLPLHPRYVFSAALQLIMSFICLSLRILLPLEKCFLQAIFFFFLPVSLKW